MAQVKVEFVLKGGDKVITTNETIIQQLVEQGAQYQVLEGDINSLIGAQEEQVQSTQELTKSYKEVLAEYKANEKELKALAIAGDTTSERYKELVQSVGSARAALEDVNLAANVNKGAFDAVFGTIGGVTAGFTAFQGALGLIGAESENVEKALLKVQSALALSQGLDQFQKSIPAFKDLGKLVSGNVTKAFGTLKGAIAATGIGLLAIAIGIVVANWDKLVEALRTAFPAFAVIEKFFANFKNIAFGVIAGVVEGFKVLGDVVGNIFKGNFTQAVAEAKNFGTRVGAAYQEGFNEAVENEQSQARIKSLEREKAFAEARGEDVLAIERKIVQEKLKLAKEGTDEYIELQIEETRIITQQKKKQEEENKAAEERITAIRKANAERRIALLNDGLTKELAQLKLNYEEQRKAARKNGEDVKLVDQVYSKQRADIIKKSLDGTFKELGNFSEETLKLSNFNYLKELVQTKEQYDALRQEAVKQRDAINALSVEERRLRLNDLSRLEGEIINLDTNFNIRRLNIQEKYLKQAQGLYEQYQSQFVDIKFFEFNPDELTKNLDDLASVISGNQQEILNDEITYRRRLFNIAFEADDLNLARAIDAFKINKDLNSEQFDFINARTRKYLDERKTLSNEELDIFLKSILERSAADKKALDDELIAFRDAEFKKITQRAQFQVQNLAIDKKETKDALDNQIKYYADLNGISNTNTRKRKQEEANISRKFEKEELDRQRKLLDEKLAAAEKAFGKESEEYKKLQLEKAKLEKKATDDSISDQERRLGAFIAVFQQFLSTLAEIGAAIDSFYELQAARTNAFYDEEVRKNTEANNNEINNYALTEEEKQNINQRYALQEAEIERKRAEDIKKIEKKRADTAFAFQIAQIIGNGALAVVRALAELGPIAGPIAAILVGATVAAQLLVANNQRKIAQQLEDGGVLSGASHSQGGIPVGNTGIEVEGGEAVINKRSTARFLPMLSAINEAGGGVPLMPRTASFMQTGGMTMSGQMSGGNSTVMKTYVVTDEVTNKQAMENKIRRQSQF